jgi:hypothetical protein
MWKGGYIMEIIKNGMTTDGPICLQCEVECATQCPAYCETFCLGYTCVINW